MLKALTALDKIRDSIEAHREQVKREVLDYLSQMPPYEFEHLIGNLLAHMSFSDCVVTQQYKDGGIDLRANFSIGISEIKTLGQVKRIRRSVGTQDLQQFYGAMVALQAKNEVHLGLYVTTSSFASGAVKWVEESSLPLVLIDGRKLVDLLVEHNLLVKQVPVPDALELDLPQADPAMPLEDEAEEFLELVEEATDGRERKRSFKWGLDIDDEGNFSLTICYLQEPDRTYVIEGVRVPREQDFRPARAALQEQIVEIITPLFPTLSKNLVRAKAWSGTHRVYPASVYGK